MKQKTIEQIERISISAMGWIGSITSLIYHTVIFGLFFVLYFLGVPVLLLFATLLSIEAIYLTIFLQMSVNLQSKKLQSVAKEVKDMQEDMVEIQENVVDIQENVEDIQENVEDIQENVEEIQKDEDEDDTEDEILERIEKTMNLLITEVSELKKQQQQIRTNKKIN
jgi:hypothetical protein